MKRWYMVEALVYLLEKDGPVGDYGLCHLGPVKFRCRVQGFK